MTPLKALALFSATAILALSDIELGTAPQFNLLSSPVEAQRRHPGVTHYPYVRPPGVARRTTRRIVRRTAVTYATLPPTCVSVTIDGLRLYSCRGFYVQYSGGTYVQVIID
jgi:hypothetical protein